MGNLITPTQMNKAKVRREDVSDNQNRFFIKDQIRSIGNRLKPFLMDYQGSFAVHMYKIQGKDEYAFISQIEGSAEIPEGQADVALKELRRTLMSQYGREAPKERT